MRRSGVRSSAITIGQRVGYTIEVTNYGPETARDVMVRDTLNAEATVVSVRSTQGSCERQLPITCSLGSVEPGQRVLITVVVEHRRTGARSTAPRA